jgi:TonB family protein
MATAAQHLLGQFVDGRFPLRKLIGVSSNSAVFLTDLPNSRSSEPAPEAAIKLIPEDPDSSDQQLERWRSAAALSHPGLLHILHFGRCSVDGSPCLYVVTELASENLGDLLPQRALSTEEATGMMVPVLATLDFLHENGLVHAGIKPSNILAIRDTIKLSSDRILPAGEPAFSWPLASPYAPPESLLFPASDIWSLGVTLYETITQYLPKQDSSGHYVVPQLPSPFSEVVHGALVQDPSQRIALDDVRALLDPSYVAKPKPVPVTAAAAQSSAPTAVPEEIAPLSAQPPLAVAAQASAATAAAVVSPSPKPAPLPKVDPLSVPLSPVSPSVATPPSSRVPVSSLPNVNVTIAAPRRVPEPEVSGGSLKFFLIGAAATLFLALLIVPRILRNSPDRPPSSSGSTISRPAKPAPASTRSASPSTSAPVATPAPSKTPPPETPSSASPSASPATAAGSAPGAATGTAAARPKPSTTSISDSDSSVPEVTHRVIPEVSQKARDTIRGTVRIHVRVQLNSDGSISSAELDSPAPSQFFANLALKAARQWQFAPSAGPSALIQFDFTNASTSASVSP